MHKYLYSKMNRQTKLHKIKINNGFGEQMAFFKRLKCNNWIKLKD